MPTFQLQTSSSTCLLVVAIVVLFYFYDRTSNSHVSNLSDINSKPFTFAKLVLVNLQTIHIRHISTVILYIKTQFPMPRTYGSLIIAIKPVLYGYNKVTLGSTGILL